MFPTQEKKKRMAHDNRIEQLEDLRNIETNADFYERLAAGKIVTTADNASSLSTNGGKGYAQPYYIPVPITIKSQIGSPTALAIGAFSTTLTTLSFALMGFRGVGTTNAFIGNFFAVAGIGMVRSKASQCEWESPYADFLSKRWCRRIGSSSLVTLMRTLCSELLVFSTSALGSSLRHTLGWPSRMVELIPLSTTMRWVSGS